MCYIDLVKHWKFVLNDVLEGKSPFHVNAIMLLNKELWQKWMVFFLSFVFLVLCEKEGGREGKNGAILCTRIVCMLYYPCVLIFFLFLLHVFCYFSSLVGMACLSVLSWWKQQHYVYCYFFFVILQHFPCSKNILERPFDYQASSSIFGHFLDLNTVAIFLLKLHLSQKNLSKHGFDQLGSKIVLWDYSKNRKKSLPFGRCYLLCIVLHL